VVDLDLVRRKFEELTVRLDQLREMAAIPAERFAADHTMQSATRYDLIVAIECCIDVGQHIHADEGWKRPAGYAGVFRGLSGHGVIPPELAEQLAQSAETRNRAVHLYDTVDDVALHQNLPELIQALLAFKEAVARWIDER